MALLDRVTSTDQGGSYIPGPELIGLNQARLRNIQDLMRVTTSGDSQGMAPFIGERPELWQPSGQEAVILKQIADLAQAGETPEGARIAPLIDMMTSGARTGFGMNDLAAKARGAVYDSPGEGISPFETQGLGVLKDLTDADGLVEAYQRYFDQIAGPQIKNNLTLMGQNGGGAWPEMVTRYMAQVAPVIEGQRRQAGTTYGGALLGMGPTLESRFLGRFGNAGGLTQGAGALTMGGASGAGALTGLMPQFLNARLGALGVGSQAAGAARQGNLQNFLWNAGTVNQALNSIPVTNYGATRGNLTKTEEANLPSYLDFGTGLINKLPGLASSLFGNQGIVPGVIGAGTSLIRGIGDLFGSSSDLGTMGTVGGNVLGTGAATAGISDTLRSASDAVGSYDWSSLPDFF